MRKADNMELLQRANVENVEEIMLPETATQLRTLTRLAISRRFTMVPDFFWKDVINVSIFPFSILVTISLSTLGSLFTKIEFEKESIYLINEKEKGYVGSEQSLLDLDREMHPLL